MDVVSVWNFHESFLNPTHIIYIQQQLFFEKIQAQNILDTDSKKAGLHLETVTFFWQYVALDSPLIFT